MHLFTEVFPIETALVEYIGAYTLTGDFNDETLARIGRALARRLRVSYPAEWVWAGGRLLTDTVRSDIEMTIALDILRGTEPERFGAVSGIAADATADARRTADFIIRTKAEAQHNAIKAALRKFDVTLPADSASLKVTRDVKLTAWAVDGAPALSITVSSRLIAGQDARALLRQLGDISGLKVGLSDISFTADVLTVSGTVGEERARLVRQKLPDALLTLIEAAPDDSPLLKLKNHNGTLRLPAAGLHVQLRPADLPRLGVEADAAERAIRPDPPTRAAIIRTLSEIFKDAGIIGRAYASREQPALFFRPTEDDLPYLRFAENRTRPAIPGKLAADFMATGAYHLHERFAGQPIRVCVVNALNTRIEDFIEALQRQLSRKMSFNIEVVRERQVRVVSEANLDAAVKIVEKESPDLILFFLPDADGAESGALADYVKNLSLGRGLPAHIVPASLVDDPDAMPALIVQMLARTGNTPAALADPLEGFDQVVGVDLVRRMLGSATQIVAIARAYANDGTFLHYAVRSADVSGDEPPYLLMRGLFGQKNYAGKKVVLHINGRLPADVKRALAVWGQAIRATFATVEIIRRGAPRLYGFADGKVTAPPLGSAFIPDNRQAFVTLTAADADDDTPNNQGSAAASRNRNPRQAVYLGQTPQPVHIMADGLSIRQALNSVRQWALLTYSTPPRDIPATILNTDALAYWLNKGGTFAHEDGDVPFWL